MENIVLPFIRVRTSKAGMITIQNIAVDTIKSVLEKGENQNIGVIIFKGESESIITKESPVAILTAMNAAVFHANQKYKDTGIVVINVENLKEVDLAFMAEE